MTEKNKKIIREVLLKIVLPLLIIGVLILIDQLTKIAVEKNLELNGERKDVIEGFFGFAYVRNTGSAFSMFSNKEWGQTLFQILTPIALIGYILLYYFIGRKYKIFTIGLILATAGTIGNYIDRLAYGYVIDFLSFTFFGWDFAIFNIADCFLTVGIFVAVFHFLFLDKDAVFPIFRKKNSDNSTNNIVEEKNNDMVDVDDTVQGENSPKES